MAELNRAAVSIRIFGDDLDPDEITAMLGRAPTGWTRKGDVRTSKSSSRIVERTGSWRVACDDRSPGDLNAQVRELLSGLSDDLDVWSAISRRYDCDVFCGLFMSEGNEGVDLDPKTLSMLGARGLRLDLDIYGPADD